MFVFTMFGHVDLPLASDRPVRRRGDTCVDPRPVVPERYRRS
jgi:hypothetical protein